MLPSLGDTLEINLIINDIRIVQYNSPDLRSLNRISGLPFTSTQAEWEQWAWDATSEIKILSYGCFLASEHFNVFTFSQRNNVNQATIHQSIFVSPWWTVVFCKNEQYRW